MFAGATVTLGIGTHSSISLFSCFSATNFVCDYPRDRRLSASFGLQAGGGGSRM